jgi:excinuclease ABC subunit C
MEDASGRMRFEEAARWRDLVARLDSFGWPVPERVADRVSRDVAAVVENWGIILQMRSGRFTGTVRLPFESRWRLAEPSERLSVLIRSYYSETLDIPREILVSSPLPDAGLLEEWLSARRKGTIGIRNPVRGASRELVDLACTDLTHFLARLAWKKPGGSRERRAAALEALADLLGLPAPPRWMVAMDASAIQGSYPVAALVSFRDGLPDKSGYRRFSMAPELGRNDPGMISDAVSRYASHIEDEAPGLFLVDGGITQLRAALAAAGDSMPGTLFAALAKREETLLVGREERTIRIPPDSPPLVLLRAMRDEVHRFVVQYHRQSRSRGEIRSGIDDIPGIGPRFRALLLGRFGSVERLRSASVDDICEIPGIGRTRASRILDYLKEGAHGCSNGEEGDRPPP